MTRLIGTTLLAFVAASCGGDDSTSPSEQTFNQTVTGTVSVFGSTRHGLTIPRNGNLTLRLTWQDPTVDLDLYLTVGNCTNLYPMASCGVLLASDNATGTVETITRSASNGEVFQVWVDNVSSRTANYSLSIVVQ